MLSERDSALMDGTAWTESPHSTTHRMISNVRAQDLGDDQVLANANLLVHRSRAGRLDAYPAHLTLLLVRGGHRAQNGMLPCLRLGRSSRLLRRSSRLRTRTRRVSAGSITSSTYPRSAAM